MNIVLCVTGSIAATESIKLARELRRQGANVKCFMSDAACEIIHPNAMEFATGQEVVSKLTGKIEHVKYSQADLILVAPATANIISKFAYKISDNPISSLLITAYGHDTPIAFVPSMHESMYKSIKDNIEKLKKEGVKFISPRIDEGKAKFPDKEDICLESLRLINMKKTKNLIGKNVLITAGGTYEPIDPIRGLTNRSSGKMGIELVKEAYRRGANVTLVAAHMEVPIPNCIETIRTYSVDEMEVECQKLINAFDVLIAVAAVSDFKPVKVKESKIPSCFELSLKLEPTNKLIKNLKDSNPEIFLVGFKAEYNVSKEKLIELSKSQIESTGTNLVVANDVAIEGAGFSTDTNKVILVDDEINEIPLKSKKEISEIVIDRLIEKL